jgi:hypothetical protein
MRALYLSFYFGLFFLLAAPAYAYLDPGTGSLLLYAIVGIAATVLFGVRNLWHMLKGRVFLAGAAVAKGIPDIVFHSEGGSYWQVFQPVLTALSREGVSCAYVTPDAADPGLSFSLPGVRAFRPGGNMATIAWMNAASTGIVVSTTPHLDVYMLRRSKRVKRYIHLFHSPTDIAFYEKYAFDWYDCLLTVGSFQEPGIRELERKRGTARKQLLPAGCTYFDSMLGELARMPANRDEPRSVLYAPAWGARSSVLTYGSGIIDCLTREGIKVIFRPHPQFYVSYTALIRGIEKRFSGTALVEIDRGRTALASMARSDVLITDLSGILFDFACLFARPILLANSDVDPGGHEGEDLPAPLWDVAASRDLAYSLVDGIESLPGLVGRARSDANDQARKTHEFRDRSFYNFGSAGPAAARQVLAVLKGLS